MIVLGVLFALVVLGMTAGSVWVMRYFFEMHKTITKDITDRLQAVSEMHQTVMKDTLGRFLARSPQELHVMPIMQNEPPEKPLDEQALEEAKQRMERMMETLGAPMG